MSHVFVSDEDDQPEDDRLANQILNGQVSGENAFAAVFSNVIQPPRRLGWFSRAVGQFHDGVLTGSLGRNSKKIVGLQGETMEKAYKAQAEGALVALLARLAVCLQVVVNACLTKSAEDNIATKGSIENYADREIKSILGSDLPEPRKQVRIAEVEMIRDEALKRVGAKVALESAKYEPPA